MPTSAPPPLHLDILQHVSIASPCEARWDDMLGDDKVRHCSLCAKNVHNLSAMTREEAEEFVRSKQQHRRACIRFYQRSDGTILTRDCPRGVAAARAKLARAAGRIAAVLGLTGLVAAAAEATGSHGRGVGGCGRMAARNSTAVRWITNRLNPPPPQTLIMGKMRMGEMVAPRSTCLPQPPTPVQTGGTSGPAPSPSR